MTDQSIFNRGTALFSIGIAWSVIELLVLFVIYPDLFIAGPVQLTGIVSLAAVINGAVFLSGILLLVSVFLLFLEKISIWITAPMAVAGIGTSGVSLVYPSDFFMQAAVILIAFFCCGLCAIVELRVIPPPFINEFLPFPFQTGPLLPPHVNIHEDQFREYSPLLTILLMRFFCFVYMFLFCLALVAGPDSLFFEIPQIGWPIFPLLFLFPLVIAAQGLNTYYRSAGYTFRGVLPRSR